MTSKPEETGSLPPTYANATYQGQTDAGYPKQAYPQQPYPQAYPGAPPGAQPYYAGQIPQTGVQPGVVTQQPVVITQQQMFNAPPDHMGYSIFVTLCCCWVCGIFAIMKSSECRSAILRGDQNMALQKSAEAKRMANMALGFGIGSVVLSFVILGIYFGVIMSGTFY